jgi:hypothetical protein
LKKLVTLFTSLCIKRFHFENFLYTDFTLKKLEINKKKGKSSYFEEITSNLYEAFVVFIFILLSGDKRECGGTRYYPA